MREVGRVCKVEQRRGLEECEAVEMKTREGGSSMRVEEGKEIDED